ncbi:MAG: SoxY-related AACIE arm protein [Limnohabitans sp.]|jgi:sulfur-oxidizing protein SoxY|nr:SoxY-related AACIE arm protein [Limnohabitans sp.]
MSTSRRHLLQWLGAAPLAAHATPEQGQAALSELLRGQAARPGRVTLDIPPLVENGNSVVMQVRVDSPMTPQDHVRAIHVVAEGNPIPRILTAHFTPHSGKAQLTARVRLGDSQRVWAIAHLSDGSFWSGHADTLVTSSACTEER